MSRRGRFLFKRPPANLNNRKVAVLLPEIAWDIVVFYAAFSMIALLLFFRRRPRSGMRLHLNRLPSLDTSIELKNERPLNVVFNYNGHSWDAYEVLGLPAGSSLEMVEQTYQNTVKTVDVGSRPFIEAAYQAIQMQWASFKKAK